MSEEYRFKDRIKDIINGDVDYDKLRKAEKQGWIDRADTGFQLFLILFFLGFFIVMLKKYFLKQSEDKKFTERTDYDGFFSWTKD